MHIVAGMNAPDHGVLTTPTLSGPSLDSPECSELHGSRPRYAR